MKTMIGTISPYIWEQDFPPVVGHTSISSLTQCPGFKRAKRGDMSAAKAVVRSCVNAKRLGELRQLYPDAVLLPVVTQTKLPMALARAVGLDICTDVYSTCAKPREEMSSMERLLRRPAFAGNVARDVGYILVEDIVSSGGMVSALRRHVISGGGHVLAVTALAHPAGSGILTPTFNSIRLLTQRFGYLPIISLLREQNIAGDLYELTNRQLEYLLCFESIDEIVKAIRDTTRDLPPIINLHRIKRSRYRFSPEEHRSML